MYEPSRYVLERGATRFRSKGIFQRKNVVSITYIVTKIIRSLIVIKGMVITRSRLNEGDVTLPAEYWKSRQRQSKSCCFELSLEQAFSDPDREHSHPDRS